MMALPEIRSFEGTGWKGKDEKKYLV